MQVGKYHQLTISSQAPMGLYLKDEAGEEVLLPTKYCPAKFTIGDELDVFVYRDSEARKIATTLKPEAALHEFGFFRVRTVANSGAFLEWGLEKDLMVPFREQKTKLEEGRWCVAYVELDEETDRLFATTHVERYLQNVKLSVAEGDPVDILVYQKTDLGYTVILNNKHRGLIYENEIFGEVNVGDRRTGFVKTIREDNKIDVALQRGGYRMVNDKNSNTILAILKEHGGFISVTDKSEPDEIYALFEMSKKAFKKAIGGLYRDRIINLEKAGIRLLK